MNSRRALDESRHPSSKGIYRFPTSPHRNLTGGSRLRSAHHAASTSKSDREHMINLSRSVINDHDQAATERQQSHIEVRPGGCRVVAGREMQISNFTQRCTVRHVPVAASSILLTGLVLVL